ncbi:DUF3263 domain-containing protein [Streptomyces inhibens]|uniref:DUF3263 domain-containing protein n=1 Tax=Streptomyces inhibens TaxID=2293571 RepID=UPI001EE6A9D0|nr:DUF3263 domain-containing protein [Streptomyces inhibens]UKY52099.1 DUF3263 domain-containing protein [Streptomyces inhibens]
MAGGTQDTGGAEGRDPSAGAGASAGPGAPGAPAGSGAPAGTGAPAAGPGAPATGSADEPGTREPAAGLSARDEAVLAVERRSWPGPGPKERAIREQLGISPTRYYQLLNALLDDPRALAHDPVTVNRLRRIRDARRARR